MLTADDLKQIQQHANKVVAEQCIGDFNCESLRNEYKNIMNRYLKNLRMVKPALKAHVVLCDVNNNPPAIIDTNKFLVDILITDDTGKMYTISAGVR